jgi:death-on-curing protein
MTTTRYLSLEHLLRLAELATGSESMVRDPGALASAAERPRSGAFGQMLYPDLPDKAAAVLHSIVRLMPLFDGNKRLGWLATYTFLRVNGAHVTATNDEAFELIMSIASGRLTEVSEIAKELAALVRQEEP